jgi:quaternary ammonium compound-resistance protein SugE
MKMAWTLLLLSGLMEIVWALGIRQTQGFTRLWPSLYTLGTMGIGFYLLALAMKSIPLGTGYAVWTGIGAVGTAICGMLFLGESRHPLRIGAILLIVIGIVSLHWLEGRGAAEADKASAAAD